jgi:hypothetical protein
LAIRSSVSTVRDSEEDSDADCADLRIDLDDVDEDYSRPAIPMWQETQATGRKAS